MEKVIVVCLIGIITLAGFGVEQAGKILSYTFLLGGVAALFYLIGKQSGEKQEQERQRKREELSKNKN